MIKYGVFLFFCYTSLLCFSQKTLTPAPQKIRKLIDTVGYASHAYQMDSVYSRIALKQGNDLEMHFRKADVTEETVWKVAVCPHDDYAYAGYIYPLSLFNVQAKTLILFGVCHKAKQFGLENTLVFDSFTHWKGPYGLVPVSSLRDEIIKELPSTMVTINDSAQQAEHSLEALIPFLQYYNHDIEIIPVLVPYMQVEKMENFAQLLAQALKVVTTRNNLVWGNDFAFVISNDAVHYGDEGWGDKNYNYYGVDPKGYEQACNHEAEIIKNTLTGEILPEKLKKFCSYTVDEKDYKEYKWTWCGRYCLPMGLFTAYYFQKLLGITIHGNWLGYSSSIEHRPIPVKDLKMDVTAPATMHHWVGYTAIGYR
ncbi:MAG: AmmeMemoRadiSam system protein B [Bacteroidetes bacterium]|nr:AmmeMemoRadiSam system protein B [Bacteroidota bacterium]